MNPCSNNPYSNKYDKKLAKSATVTLKCERKLLQCVTAIVKFDND